MLILQCILGFHSQSIDFKNSFAHADIPSGGAVFVELPRDFKSDGGQHDVVTKLKKSLYGQAKAAHLCMKIHSQSKNDNVMKSFKEDGPS